MRRIRWYLVILAALFTAAQLCVAAPISPETIELPTGWRMASAWDVVQDGAAISQSSYDAGHWHPIARMPVTILEALQEGEEASQHGEGAGPAHLNKVDEALGNSGGENKCCGPIGRDMGPVEHGDGVQMIEVSGVE